MRVPRGVARESEREREGKVNRNAPDIMKMFSRVLNATTIIYWRPLDHRASPPRSLAPAMLRRSPRLLLTFLLLLLAATPAVGQSSFEEAVIDVGNVGITITNSGFLGKANVRNNPAGPPSFEYPLDSGIEHLFEAGLWIGARRSSDQVITVRTGAVTSSGGYRPGSAGYEYAPTASILERSTLVTSDAYNSQAISHQDYVTAYADTFRVLPGTQIPMPDVQGRLGAVVEQSTYAWNFPFAEYFAVVNFDIINTSGSAWDSVYVGIFSDIVVRNVNTTTDQGSAFFNKGGLGYVDDLHAQYAFNAGGTEETINTYGAISFLGAEWNDPRAGGDRRFFHPNVAERYEADGYAAPYVNPRWWKFSGGSEELSRPNSDQARYDRMARPYPNPELYADEAAYQEALDRFRERLRTEGLISEGNWISLLPVGPFPRVEPGDTLQVTFAFVAAMKPEEFQGQAGKEVDTEESRSILRNNLEWARRTYAGEDQNLDGTLDPGEDLNENGQLDRYLIPEPPSSPSIRVQYELTEGSDGEPRPRPVLYWDRSAESSVDPVTGEQDFEGYRVYRSNPGDDRLGNILDRTTLIAQWDTPGTRTGYNTGFDEVRLDEPVTFEGDSTRYWYRFELGELLPGWQYLVAVTSFDRGDPDTGLPSFESSRVASSRRVFAGTPPVADGSRKVGVYPNPYRLNAAWDGGSARTRKLNFYNLPPRSIIRIYTLAGEIVAQMDHDADEYQGDIRWYDNFSGSNRQLPGGEHSWDLLSESGLDLSAGLYFFSVENRDSGDVQTGKFVIIK